MLEVTLSDFSSLIFWHLSHTSCCQMAEIWTEQQMWNIQTSDRTKDKTKRLQCRFQVWDKMSKKTKRFVFSFTECSPSGSSKLHLPDVDQSIVEIQFEPKTKHSKKETQIYLIADVYSRMQKAVLRLLFWWVAELAGSVGSARVKGEWVVLSSTTWPRSSECPSLCRLP